MFASEERRLRLIVTETRLRPRSHDQIGRAGARAGLIQNERGDLDATYREDPGAHDDRGALDPSCQARRRVIRNGSGRFPHSAPRARGPRCCPIRGGGRRPAPLKLPGQRERPSPRAHPAGRLAGEHMRRGFCTSSQKLSRLLPFTRVGGCPPCCPAAPASGPSAWASRAL